MTRRDYSATDAYMARAEETWDALGIGGVGNGYKGRELKELRRAHIALAPVQGAKVALVTVKTLEQMRHAFAMEASGYEVTVEPQAGVLSGFTRPVSTRTVPNMEDGLGVLLRLLADKGVHKELVIPSHLVPEASDMAVILNTHAELLLTPNAIAGLMRAAGFKGRFQKPWSAGYCLDDLLVWHKPSRSDLEAILGQNPTCRIINAVGATEQAPWFRGLSPCGRVLLGDGATCQITEIDVGGYPHTWEHLGKVLGVIARQCYREQAHGLSLRDDGRGHGELDAYLRLQGLAVTGLRDRAGYSPDTVKALRRDVTLSVWDMADHMGLPRSKAVFCEEPREAMDAAALHTYWDSII